MLFSTRTTAVLAALVGMPAVAAAQGQPALTQTETVGLPRAVEAAEAALPGRALEAEMESDGDRLVYEVDLVQNGEVYQALVDSLTGEVISMDEQTISGAWRGWFDADLLQAAEAAPRSLAEILAAVEAETGGRAEEAGLEEEDGRIFYEVELAEAGGGDVEVLVDPATGEILPGEIDD